MVASITLVVTRAAVSVGVVGVSVAGIGGSSTSVENYGNIIDIS